MVQNSLKSLLAAGLILPLGAIAQDSKGKITAPPKVPLQTTSVISSSPTADSPIPPENPQIKEENKSNCVT